MREILDLYDQVVGHCQQLDCGKVAITFIGKYQGVFITFAGWNSQHGGTYRVIK